MKKIIRTYAEEENCEAIFRRSGSEFIILRIPKTENRRFHDRKSAVLVLDVPWRQHFFFFDRVPQLPAFYGSGYTINSKITIIIYF
jgi:hypothetical protein